MSSPSTVVLITGANSGVGYATSKVIASASANYHIIMACRSSEKGNAASEEIVQAAGIKGKISSIQLDVTDQSSITAAAKRVERDHGCLDVLVNNAGIVSKAPTLKEQIETTLNTNAIGAAIVAEAFVPLLMKSSNPYLLYISSSLGSLTVATDPQIFGYELDARAYRMSKAALNILMLQDWKMLGKQGLKVFAVCPGLVESGLRGQGPLERSAGGKAGDPEVSGQTILRIIEGEREADVVKFVHKDGVYPW